MDMSFRPGDEVLAHWALPNGEPSCSLEEAIVLSMDEASAKTRLRYVDGMELVVPSNWILRCKPSGVFNDEKLWWPTAIQKCCFQQNQKQSHSMLGFAPADGGDYVLERLIQSSSSHSEISLRVRDLCDLPRGMGLQPLAAAVSSALPSAPELGQLNCMDALCALCSGGFDHAEAARHFANAILLSRCGRIPCTPRQHSVLRFATALSDTQRKKLMDVAHTEAWVPA